MKGFSGSEEDLAPSFSNHMVLGASAVVAVLVLIFRKRSDKDPDENPDKDPDEDPDKDKE